MPPPGDDRSPERSFSLGGILQTIAVELVTFGGEVLTGNREVLDTC